MGNDLSWLKAVVGAARPAFEAWLEGDGEAAAPASTPTDKKAPEKPGFPSGGPPPVGGGAGAPGKSRGVGVEETPVAVPGATSSAPRSGEAASASGGFNIEAKAKELWAWYSGLDTVKKVIVGGAATLIVKRILR